MNDRSHFARFDPTWNYIPLVSLVYALPLALLSAALSFGWIATPRDFWGPLAAVLAMFALHMGLEKGLPWVATDFQHRHRFQPTLVLAYALFWVSALRIAHNTMVAVLLFLAIAVAYDLLLIASDVLLPLTKGVPSILVWSVGGALFALDHAFGIAALVAGCVVIHLVLRAMRSVRWTRDVRRVAVIGGGWSGIYATKWLAQCGLDVTCFESSDSIGGIWKFREDKPGGVFRNTIVTSSKHLLHACDFPFDDEDHFPHHSQVFAFLQRYIDHFGIRDRFRLNASVQHITRTKDGWLVDGEPFDAVVIASGPYQKPRRLEELYGRFTGRALHSFEYKDASAIEPGQTVVVVGGGESGSDIAAECAARGARVHWSLPHGQWFADAYLGPYPTDHLFAFGMRAFVGRFGNAEYVMRSVVARLISRRWGIGGHGVPAWAPDAPNLHHFLNKSRDAIREIEKGNITPVTDVVSVDGRTITFEDGRSVEADVVILATGFDPQWPFLETPPSRLFRKVFTLDDPTLAEPTLAFVGFVRPVLGSIPSLSELQSRWIAHVWSGRVPLPSAERCARAAAYDEMLQRRWFLDRSRLGVFTDHEVYASETARLLGAAVPWGRLLLTNPRLFWMLLLAPWSAFKYQLNDPQTRAAAIERIRALAPDAGHPIQKFKYWVGLVLVVPMVVTALLALAVPVRFVPAILGALMLSLTAALRLTEIRPRWRT